LVNFEGTPTSLDIPAPRSTLSRVSSGEEIRLGLTLHYDGSGFSGWQAQNDTRTVQGELEAVAARLTGKKRTVLGSGRTDSGVHATGQVAAVNVPARWTPAEFRRAANAVLPSDVWVREARQARPGFHPRYDALARTYLYRIGLGEEAWSPFRKRWCWPLRDPMDVALLDRSAGLIPGERSFAAFAKTGQPERGDRCHVRTAHWSPWELGLAFTITADRYLHHMVRYLVGTMVDVARGRRPIEEMAALLNEDRSGLTTSPPAPAEGLFLAGVDYPEEVWEVEHSHEGGDPREMTETTG
jgi:tRNA pseudouridine38-40 synthase